jgi:hypothetical protein
MKPSNLPSPSENKFRFLGFSFSAHGFYVWSLVLLALIFFWRVLLNPRQMLFGIDTVLNFSFDKFFASEFLKKTGELPLWDPFSFGGRPFLGHGQDTLFYPFQFLFYLFPTDFVFGFSFLFTSLVAGIGLYFLMGAWGLSPFSSFVSALTLMFSLRFVASVFSGHLPHLTQAAWAPFAFLFLELTIQRNSVGYSFLTGLVLGFSFLAGHVQMIFYLSFFLVLYLFFRVFQILYQGLRIQAIQVVSLFFLSGLTALALSAVQLFPMIEGIPYWLRSEGLHFKRSGIHMVPEHLIRLLFPYNLGTPLDYQGDLNMLLETTLYVGVLPLILSIFSICVYRRNPNVLFWAGVSIFSLLFAMGRYTPLYPLFHNYFPGFGLFKTPPRMFWFFALALSILAGYGAQSLLEPKDEKVRGIQKKFLFALAMISGLGFFLFVYLKINIPSMFLFYLLVLVSILLLLKKIKPKMFPLWFQTMGKPVLVAVILFDLWFHGMPLIKTVDPARYFKKTHSVTFLEQMEGKFRVLDQAGDLFKHIGGRSHIENLGGYSSAILNHYARFYGLIWEAPDFKPSIADMPLYPLEAIKNRHLLDLLNARFIITGNEISLSGFLLVHHSVYPPKERSKEKEVFIYENLKAFPRAFMVPNAIVVSGEDQILNALRQLNPKETVILEIPFEELRHSGKFQEVTITSHQPNRIHLKVQLDHPGFLVLSEIFFPGWKAFDNGVEKKVLKANYALRSIFLEKGEHRIEFIYDPFSFRIGGSISTLTLLLLVGYGIFTWKRRKDLKKQKILFG